MKVILTFDYEMFFGKSGTIDACLIEPTNEIINVLKKYDAHASFFVDTTFLLFLLKNGLVKEYDRIEQQLIELIQLGHRLELHIHPHWLDAKYDKRSSKFMFPTYNRYILSSCEIDIQKKLFSDGISLLIIHFLTLSFLASSNTSDNNFFPIPLPLRLESIIIIDTSPSNLLFMSCGM